MMHHPQQQHQPTHGFRTISTNSMMDLHQMDSSSCNSHHPQHQQHFVGQQQFHGGTTTAGAATAAAGNGGHHHHTHISLQQQQQQHYMQFFPDTGNTHMQHPPHRLLSQAHYHHHHHHHHHQNFGGDVADTGMVLPQHQQQQQQQHNIPLQMRNINNSSSSMPQPPTASSASAASSQSLQTSGSSNNNNNNSNKLCVSQLSRWKTLEKLGAGTYGVVFRCEDTLTGQSVAMKRIPEQRQEEGVPSIAIREISLLCEVRHPNVVSLLNVVPRDKELVLIFEYVDQDLKKLLDSRVTPFSGKKLKWIMYQLLQGLYACHSRRIAHRDLKPQNILVSKDGVVKIADFGLARSFHVTMQTYTKEVVTLWYRAPEILLGEKHYRPAIDMWSLGCIMGELATKRAMFPGDCEIHQLFLIFRVFGTPSATNWPGATQLPQFNTAFPGWQPQDLAAYLPSIDADGLDLIRGMLRVDPMERISAAEALRHRWFDAVREQYAHQFSDFR